MTDQVGSDQISRSRLVLRQALAEGFPFVHELHIDQNLEPLRGYPAFDDLLRPGD